MKKIDIYGAIVAIIFLLCLSPLVFGQTDTWETDYVTLDDGGNGTGDQTTSAAVFAPNRFVAIVCQTPSSPILDNLFNPPGNYLVGYWDADSALGRIPSLINGTVRVPDYNTDNQWTDWISGLDQVRLLGAYQIASGPNNYVYVANNDGDHNILVFELTSTEVVSTDFRMTTGTENIYAIEVDNNGYVYVVDYQGDNTKTDELKVYAPIGAPGTTWGDFGGHNDAPVATIDLPEGTYLGVTTNGDGTEVYVSASHDRSIWKYTGSPTGGYILDNSFLAQLAPDDTVANGGHGVPSYLGLAYMEDPASVIAAVDTFLYGGGGGGYPYGRIYRIDPTFAITLDTIDVAEWNLAVTGDYSSGSSNGRAGGYTSMVDLDVEQSENAVYSQTYYGWAVEKWTFDGTLTDIRPISATVPAQFDLRQNYPNPFNPSTTIEFDVRQTGAVTLEIFNLIGQRIGTLVNEIMEPGTYQATFDAANLPSGVYLYQLKSGDFTATRKMILAR